MYAPSNTYTHTSTRSVSAFWVFGWTEALVHSSERDKRTRVRPSFAAAREETNGENRGTHKALSRTQSREKRSDGGGN